MGAAIRAARFPPSPKRKYDLIGEAMARPFGERIGRGRLREGGVMDDEDTVPPGNDPYPSKG
jgi:hypothetical protein